MAYEHTGKRVRLVRMEDPYTNLRPGSEGEITGIDGIGQIQVKWSNGSTLSLIPGVDEYKILDTNKKVLEFNQFPGSAENSQMLGLLKDEKYIMTKLTEMGDLFEDEYNCDIDIRYYPKGAIRIDIYYNGMVYLFDVDLLSGIIHEINSSENAGQPQDSHVENKVEFETYEEARDILEKKILSILGVYESLKHIRKFEELDWGTYKRAATKLRTIGHEKRADKLDTFSNEVYYKSKM